MKRSELSLIDLFRVAPPEVFASYFCRVLESYIKTTAKPASSHEIWQYMMTLAFSNKEETPAPKDSVHEPDKFRELVQSSLQLMWRFGGANIIKKATELFTDLKLESGCLFQLYITADQEQQGSDLKKFLQREGALQQADYALVVRTLLQ